MAINTKLQTDIAFKRLAGNVSITNPNSNQFQESIGSSVQLSTDVIFGEAIPNAPGLSSLNTTASNAAGAGVVQLVRFDLVAIGDSIYDADDTVQGLGQSATAGAFDTVDAAVTTTHSFALHFPSNYEQNQPANAGNLKAGTGFFTNSTALTGSLGAVQIVPPRFGADYVPVVKDESGAEISIVGSEQDFYLDTFAGVLFRQNGDNTSTSVPKTIDAYVYIGKMASESLAQAPTEGLAETLTAGNTAENDIILTGSLIVTASAGAVDIVDFSGVNSVTASAFVAQNADINSNLNVDGNTQIDGTLTVDGNVTLGNATSDIVTIAGDLIVQGDLTEINTAQLLVEDPFILLNSSSGVPSNTNDGGIIVQRDVIGSTPHGTALFYDESAKAWGIKGASGSLAAVGVDHTNQSDVTPDVLLVTVESQDGTPTAQGVQVPKVGDSDNLRYGQMYVDQTPAGEDGGLYIYLPGNLG